MRAFKDRWLQPLFIALPVALAVTLRPGYTNRRVNILGALGGISLVVLAFVASGRLLFTEQRGRRDVLNTPFRALAPRLAPAISRADFIVAEAWLAGNLTLWFPDKIAITPEMVPNYGVAGDKCLLIWEVRPRMDPPRGLTVFANAWSSAPAPGNPEYVEERWKYHRDKKIRIGLLPVNR